MTEATGLRLLDQHGQKWEWVAGPWDFHCAFDQDAKAWLLERFETSEGHADAAHREETEHDTLQDALVHSLTWSEPSHAE